MAIIAIGMISAGNRLRSLREGTISGLAESIATIGLQQPISVRRQDQLPEGEVDFQESYMLIAGLHRLEACRRLGMTEIEANVVTLGEAERQLWEIDENLCRADLTELERGEHLAKRKQIYEWWRPETRHGANRQPSGQFGHTVETAFAVDTAAKTGISDRHIRRAIHRSEQIDEKVRDRIRDIPEIADSGVELDTLAAMQPAEQRKAVAMVETGQAVGIRDAKKLIEPKPVAAPKPAPEISADQKWWQQFVSLMAAASDANRQRAREYLDETVADNIRLLRG